MPVAVVMFRIRWLLLLHEAEEQVVDRRGVSLGAMVSSWTKPTQAPLRRAMRPEGGHGDQQVEWLRRTCRG